MLHSTLYYRCISILQSKVDPREFEISVCITMQTVIGQKRIVFQYKNGTSENLHVFRDISANIAKKKYTRL